MTTQTIHTPASIEYVLASTTPPRLFNFYPTASAGQRDTARANTRCLAPDGGYTVMTYPAYRAGERQFYLSDPLTTITEATYDEMCDVLPPLYYRHSGAYSSFLMSEFHAHVYTMMYASLRWCETRHYVCRMVDATDTATWITADEIRTRIATEER